MPNMDITMTETLTFTKPGMTATIVTDGQNVRSYEPTACKSHETLKKAIAYIESRGYLIVMDQFA